MSYRTQFFVLGGVAAVSVSIAAACATNSGDESSNADAIRREGETADTSEGLDPSQCEAILIRAAAVVKTEGRAANPKRLLLSSKDISCLAYEVEMRKRATESGAPGPNPYDVLLAQLFFAAQLGSKAGFEGGGPGTTSSGGGTDPGTDPGTVDGPACLAGYVGALDAKVAEGVSDRQVCVGFGPPFKAYLDATPGIKGLLEAAPAAEVTVGGDGAAVVFEPRLRTLTVPWHFGPDQAQALSREIVVKNFNFDLAQTGAFDQGGGTARYSDNMAAVEIHRIRVTGDVAALAEKLPDAAKILVKIERAEMEGNVSSCTLDYVKVFQGATEIRTICGGQTGTFELPVARDTRFVMTSDSSNTGKGIKLSWGVIIK